VVLVVLLGWVVGWRQGGVVGAAQHLHGPA
jgi:hypothetical protein